MSSSQVKDGVDTISNQQDIEDFHHNDYEKDVDEIYRLFYSLNVDDFGIESGMELEKNYLLLMFLRIQQTCLLIRCVSKSFPSSSPLQQLYVFCLTAFVAYY